MKPSALQRSKAAWSPTSVATSSAPCILGTRSTRGERPRRETAATSTLDDRAQRHQLLELSSRAVVLVERDACSRERASCWRIAEQVVARRVGLDLQHRAVRAHRRRADLDQEVARDRDPRGMAAGERLEADVAEGLDEQRGGRLGVHRGVAEVDGAAEAQLVADDVVARVGDRMADDRDLVAVGGDAAWRAHGDGRPRATMVRATDARRLERLRFTDRHDPDERSPMQIEVKGRNLQVTDELREHASSGGSRRSPSRSPSSRCSRWSSRGAQPGQPRPQVAEATLHLKGVDAARQGRLARRQARDQPRRRRAGAPGQAPPRQAPQAARVARRRGEAARRARSEAPEEAPGDACSSGLTGRGARSR